MSKIDELIQQYCPNGVEYKTLGEVAHYSKTRVCATSLNANSYVSVESLLPNKQGKIDSVVVPTTGQCILFEEGDILIGNIRP